MVDTRRRRLPYRTEVETRTDRADRVLEIQALLVTQHAPLDVVLLGGHPCRLSVRRDRDGPQVVRDAASLDLEIRLVAVAQFDDVLDSHGGRAHNGYLAAVDRAAAFGHDVSRAFAWQWRCDETRNVDDFTVSTDGDMPRIAADADAVHDGVIAGVNLQQSPGCLQDDKDEASGRRFYDSKRLRSIWQRYRPRDCECVRIDDADRRIEFVGDPHLPVAGHGKCPRRNADIDFGDPVVRARGENADRIVVLVDDPDSVVASGPVLKRNIGRHCRTIRRERQVNRHDDSRYLRRPSAVDGRDCHVIDAGVGKRMLDQRR